MAKDRIINFVQIVVGQLNKEYKMKRVFIVLIIFGTWAILSAGAIATADEDLMAAASVTKFKEGISAPAFTTEDVAGRSVKLEDFRGKVILLDFWATW
jgi:cytochrome oxidase Cu insertion factor (SCO1/SenC/PrrC family)